VFGSILFRMILWELVKVFLMSLVGITGILLMAGIVAEATQQGLSPTQILAAIPLLIPSTLPYTIPATTLFATCVVYGRLAADNEILAIKSAGVNVLAVVKPGLVLGLAMSAATMGLYYRVIPYTHLLLRTMVFRDAEELLYSLLRKEKTVKHSTMPYSMFVQGVKGKKLINPVFKSRNSQGQFEVVAQAREAELRVDKTKPQQVLLVHMQNGVALGRDGSRAYFYDKIWDVPLPSAAENRRPRDMTWDEILERRARLEAEAEETAVQEALTDSQMLLGGPPDLPKHNAALRARVAFLRQQILVLDVELLMRPALSLGCLFFIVIGCPVGIWFSRSDYLSSFITCFLPIVFLYYPLVLCGTGMAKEGRFDPVVLVLGPDVLIGAVGVILFWRLLRN
jgi:lipopolysaccharide export system permease protein